MKHLHGRQGDQADWRCGGFALYVHWPFCQSKCPYCDFNSHVSAAIDQRAWAEAFRQQITAWSRAVPGRVLTSIFFGGGTPSLMDPETVHAVIDAARAAWAFANDIEITLEANPGSVEAGRFAAYADAGVNRISIGIQSLDDTALRALGRRHSVKEALGALETARNTFERVSFDLIYGRQAQSLASWESELRGALALEPEHLSLYQLTIEDGTAFADRYNAGKLHGLPDESLGADLYLRTQDICAQAGLPGYEVSNHCRPGQESRHNLVYWRYGDYIGVGPGAHGRVTLPSGRVATTAPRNPAEWLRWSRDTDPTQQPHDALSAEDQATEYLLMSLRLTEGSDLHRYRRLAGKAISSATLDDLEAQGLLWVDGERFGATDMGRPLLNALIRTLL